MEYDKDGLQEAWRQAKDENLIQAGTVDFHEYSASAQTAIESEAKHRGLMDKISAIRKNDVEYLNAGEIASDAYSCSECNKKCLNFETGRCNACNVPIKDLGYCKECDKYWP
ncbi:MAG: hypothetical protein Q7T18_03505 [Sedimentisphaerales bacterium]|nr:hypothetical protein [Sedimentisphaerales bacterium]